MKNSILILLLILTGCVTERRATRYMQTHGFFAASYCASAFPVKDTVVFKPGRQPVIPAPDTILIPGDSIPCPVSIVPEKVKCPDGTIIKIPYPVPVHDTMVITRENTAKAAALQSSLDKQSTSLQNAENGRKKWRQWALITWAILAVGIAGFVMSKFRII